VSPLAQAGERRDLLACVIADRVVAGDMPSAELVEEFKAAEALVKSLAAAAKAVNA
jgi:hypothetical protein